MAIVGSTGLLENVEDIVQQFGLFTTTGNGIPMARISQMLDVLNKITVDALIGPMDDGEREYALDHILSLKRNDLLLLDRGYPAFWLFKLIMSVGGNFCARATTSLFKGVDSFIKTGKNVTIIGLKASYPAQRKCLELGLNADPIAVRLIRVELETGEIEVLMTSLIDSNDYPTDIFTNLYHDRWPVETDYNMMKNRIAVEGWSGKSVLAVYQDFHAKVLSKNLVAFLAHQAQDEIDRKMEKGKYPYQVNFTQALSKFKDTIVILF